ncbi:hypothetical protein ACE6H2_023699 [Prunus campanulata]
MKKKKSIEVETSNEGSLLQKTARAKPRKSKSSVATSSSKKRTSAKRFSSPMGSGVFGVRVFIPKDRNPYLLVGEKRVFYESLSTPYWKKMPKDDKKVDRIARAFILCLIGSSFLNDKSQYMSMHYAPSLEIVSEIGNYDWGGVALSCLYRSMDSCSRGRSSSMGGYWRA